MPDDERPLCPTCQETSADSLPAGADGEGSCHSARNCEGKVLPPKSARSCLKAGGKSWMNVRGECFNF